MNRSLMKYIRDYWELLYTYVRPQLIYILGLAFILITGIGLQLYTPRILRDFIDMTLTGQDHRVLVQKAVLFFTLVFISQLITIIITYLSERVAWTATNLLRVKLAEHCLRLDMSFHQKYPPGVM